MDAETPHPAAQDGRTSLPDSMALYLREIARTPLLTAAQEVALAQRIEAGDAAAARDLATANLRLVVSVARRYRTGSLPLEDVIAEGNLGLLRAVQTFDWRKGTRFSTYAVWWIRQAIVRAMANTGHAIRLPVYVREQMRERDAALHELASTLEREPTAAEVEAHLGPQREGSALAVGRQMAAALVSLDAALSDDKDAGTLAHLIPDEAIQPDERVTQRLLSSHVQEVLQTALTARERTVIRARFGLDGGDHKTLAEVAPLVGVTRERVRQIEARALEKLRDALGDADLRSA